MTSLESTNLVHQPARRSLSTSLDMLAWLSRLSYIAAIIVLVNWLSAYLGGFGTTPRKTETGNDTSNIFNWHPLLMSLAFLVCMSEAVNAYRVHPYSVLPRRSQKMVHFGLHTTAVLLLSCGLVAAFQSHNLKRPASIPNLYSVHSFLGLAVASLVYLQYLVGASSFLWPKLPLPTRRAVSPYHVFLGLVVYVGGLATLMVGTQEKTTFAQRAVSNVYSPTMRLPAIFVILVFVTGVSVLSQHTRLAVQPGAELASLES